MIIIKKLLLYTIQHISTNPILLLLLLNLVLNYTTYNNIHTPLLLPHRLFFFIIRTYNIQVIYRRGYEIDLVNHRKAQGIRSYILPELTSTEWDREKYEQCRHESALFSFRWGVAQKVDGEEYRVLRRGGTERHGTGEFCLFQRLVTLLARRSHPLYSNGSKFRDDGWTHMTSAFIRE